MNGELRTIVGQLESVGADARAVFGGLDARQLNWKPSAEEWSVGQCFEHLIETGRYFFPTLERIAAGTRRESAWERWSPFSGLIGRIIVGAVQPGAKRKFKAPGRVRPSGGTVGADVIGRFAETQRQLAERIEAIAGLDAAKIVVTSPISRFVTYSLLDACRIVVTHERRHFEQARRVTEAKGFPRGKE